MNRVLTAVFLALIILGATACHSDEGARQFVPGKGWVPTK
jgi:hypothetical protein